MSFAVKIVSRDIAHKTEAGGVKPRRSVPRAARSARGHRERPGLQKGCNIDGVLVSEMAKGIEALIGVVNDPGFWARGRPSGSGRARAKC